MSGTKKETGPFCQDGTPTDINKSPTIGVTARPQAHKNANNPATGGEAKTTTEPTGLKCLVNNFPLLGGKKKTIPRGFWAATPGSPTGAHFSIDPDTNLVKINNATFKEVHGTYVVHPRKSNYAKSGLSADNYFDIAFVSPKGKIYVNGAPYPPKATTAKNYTLADPKSLVFLSGATNNNYPVVLSYTKDFVVLTPYGAVTDEYIGAANIYKYVGGALASTIPLVTEPDKFYSRDTLAYPQEKADVTVGWKWSFTFATASNNPAAITRSFEFQGARFLIPTTYDNNLYPLSARKATWVSTSAVAPVLTILGGAWTLTYNGGSKATTSTPEPVLYDMSGGGGNVVHHEGSLGGGYLAAETPQTCGGGNGEASFQPVLITRKAIRVVESLTKQYADVQLTNPLAANPTVATTPLTASAYAGGMVQQGILPNALSGTHTASGEHKGRGTTSVGIQWGYTGYPALEHHDFQEPLAGLNFASACSVTPFSPPMAQYGSGTGISFSLHPYFGNAAFSHKGTLSPTGTNAWYGSWATTDDPNSGCNLSDRTLFSGTSFQYGTSYTCQSQVMAGGTVLSKGTAKFTHHHKFITGTVWTRESNLTIDGIVATTGGSPESRRPCAFLNVLYGNPNPCPNSGYALQKSYWDCFPSWANSAMGVNRPVFFPGKFSSRQTSATGYTNEKASFGSVSYDCTSKDYIYYSDSLKIYVDMVLLEQRPGYGDSYTSMSSGSAIHTLTINVVVDYLGNVQTYPYYTTSSWEYIITALKHYGLEHDSDLPLDAQGAVPTVRAGVGGVFPRYRQQECCPYVAYTTLDEVAAGATPQCYVDISLRLSAILDWAPSGAELNFVPIQALNHFIWTTAPGSNDATDDNSAQAMAFFGKVHQFKHQGPFKVRMYYTPSSGAVKDLPPVLKTKYGNSNIQFGRI